MVSTLERFHFIPLKYRMHGLLNATGYEDASFAYEALDSLNTRFKVPLEKAEADCSLLQEEWDDMVEPVCYHNSFLAV